MLKPPRPVNAQLETKGMNAKSMGHISHNAMSQLPNSLTNHDTRLPTTALDCQPQH
ncbi:hypothetical protein B0T26DRAFT_706304 [Lasiosphaeria miniovina]|uniref:Uncharacterized protein n=1 Tax=Lasiosphaeria miniovina TaxID=1954250 RepID=A0AA40AWM6_9PEZI|nr:uncharacterized protein B0T26DRAFT_706304 [Lasiosphaeria miniovina]KAK0723385.1 hypothetical protein B0T26DRAFT_706304 [Lasiosphaeria miniovina]